MPMFQVTTIHTGKHQVEAEYHVVDDNFLVFKTENHKQVACFNTSYVVSAVRLQGKTMEIGTVTVKVVPELDEAGFAALLEQAAKRAGASLA